MFMTRAYVVSPANEGTVNCSSPVSLHETTLWCDHMPDKSELKGYWTPFAWNQMPEPCLLSEYKVDVQNCMDRTARMG